MYALCFHPALTCLPAFDFWGLIDIKNDLFSLFRHLQWLVSIVGPNSLLGPFRGCAEGQTPAWLSLFVDLFKEREALRRGSEWGW